MHVVAGVAVYTICRNIHILVVINVEDGVSAGEAVDFRDEPNPHNVAGLLKLYLRELNEPLMTFGLYDAFIATQRMLTHPSPHPCALF